MDSTPSWQQKKWWTMKNNWVIWMGIIVIIYVIFNNDDKPKNHRFTNHNYDNLLETTNQIPPNATAECRDGTYSYSTSRSGTCSHHGGVKYWLNDNPSTPETTSTRTYTSTSTQIHTANTQSIQNPFETIEPTQNTHQIEQTQQIFTVEQAKQMYEQEIFNINQAWQALDPNFRESIRLEQRTINNQREAECTIYGQNQSQNPEEQLAYRHLCEVPRLQARTRYLQENRYTRIIEPTFDKTNNPIMDAPRVPTNPPMTLKEAKNAYDIEIYHINQVWQALDPEFRESIRLEQRAINNQRESECTAYGKAQSNNPDIAKTYRYLCEVPRLQERTKYLQQQPMELS